ncbi:expressed unknown protein [Seminavis robusta]|uniref:Uncharacterized protein n=1 Tax=Seminavis robusta TaxID=568900 RepID=A0A9N8DU05_9STRA|nr:expressed unknown protein [Seminavis robusta]|eukprot:Sro350_g123790.1 n/a (674) ;mRNA; f:71667-73688
MKFSSSAFAWFFAVATGQQVVVLSNNKSSSKMVWRDDDADVDVPVLLDEEETGLVEVPFELVELEQAVLVDVVAWRGTPLELAPSGSFELPPHHKLTMTEEKKDGQSPAKATTVSLDTIDMMTTPIENVANNPINNPINDADQKVLMMFQPHHKNVDGDTVCVGGAEFPLYNTISTPAQVAARRFVKAVRPLKAATTTTVVVVVETVVEDDNDIADEKMVKTSSAADAYGPGAIVLYIAPSVQQHTTVVVETVAEDDDDIEDDFSLPSMTDEQDAFFAQELAKYVEQQQPQPVETEEENDQQQQQPQPVETEKENDQQQPQPVETEEENDQQPCVVIENLPEDMPHSIKCWTGDNACYNSCWVEVSEMTSVLSEDESLEELFVDVVVKDNNQQADNVEEDNVVEDNVVEDCDEFSLTAEEIAFIERYEAKQVETVEEDDNILGNDDDDESIDDFPLTDEEEVFIAQELAKQKDQTDEEKEFIAQVLAKQQVVVEDDNILGDDEDDDESIDDFPLTDEEKDFIAQELAKQKEPIVVETVVEDDDEFELDAKVASTDDGYGPGAMVLYLPQVNAFVDDNAELEAASIEEPVQQQTQPRRSPRLVGKAAASKDNKPEAKTGNNKKSKATTTKGKAQKPKTARKKQSTTTTTTPASTERRTTRSGRLVKQPNWFIPA